MFANFNTSKGHIVMLEDIVLKLATIKDLPAMQEAGSTLFDYDVKPNRAKEFLADPRHHLALAYYHDVIIGMASGFHYVHPDKEPALFVNEVSVVEEYHNRGIGRNLVTYLCDYAKNNLDCTEAWIATEKSNIPAQKAYLAAGGKEDEESIVLYTFDLTV